MPKPIEVGALIPIVLAPDTCVYMVSLLLGSIILHTLGACLGDTALLNCAPPALNFGVSAVLLKALAHTLVLLVNLPTQLTSWAVLISLIVLLLSVRSAAATPLRRAMEVHDNLSVLTNYGAVSSAAAAFTGIYIYDELKDFNFEQRATVVVVVAVHCW